MRITVEIDQDVESLLLQSMQKSSQSLETILNQAIRRGLADLLGPSDEPPFTVNAKNMGLRPGVDYSKINQLAAEMEVEAYLEVTRKLEERLSNQQP